MMIRYEIFLGDLNFSPLPLCITSLIYALDRVVDDDTIFAVHTGGGQHAEPDDAVDRPVRVYQTSATRPAAPEQARRTLGVRRVGRVDGGRGGVCAEVRVARRPADSRHGVDAVLRGLLRGCRVRRAVGRRGVQPTSCQPDAVHHVAKGGRGPRTAASAHAHHDGRVQAGHPGGVHTEEHCRRPVEGKQDAIRYMIFFERGGNNVTSCMRNDGV